MNARVILPYSHRECYKGNGGYVTSKTSLQRAVWSNRISAMRILLRFGAFGDLRGGTYDAKSFHSDVFAPLWLALYVAKSSEDDKVDTRVAVLKCLLQHRLMSS